ncbi:MAG: tetratricopeptide repeat protein [Gemmatimonadetes bacterium]|nr:tetratricopeptide repeat protein [Gemmatimonadota bacterium]
MGFWKRILGTETEQVDYYAEGVELLNAGKYHEALTSFRLAQRATPEDSAVLQQIAITYTRIGMTDEAIRTYRKVLGMDGNQSGAHYGLAFLLLHQGDRKRAADHLRSFLAVPPESADAQRHIAHAKKTLADLETDTAKESGNGDGAL